MELKNALAVCLISMFSATLVLLIARSLDMQAADRLEPQLARIVDELEAIRQQGGISTGAAAGPSQQPEVENGLTVYYFHGNIRCPTCRDIESQSHELVQTEFASQLADDSIRWEVLNYEEPSGEVLGKKFEVQMPVVVLAQVQDGVVANWRRLDRVWALVGDKEKFKAFVSDEIHAMLNEKLPGEPTPAEGDSTEPDGLATDIPVPGTDSLETAAEETTSVAPDIPVPAADELPIPE